MIISSGRYSRGRYIGWPYFYNLLVGPSYIPSPLYLATRLTRTHPRTTHTYTRLHEREPAQSHWPAGQAWVCAWVCVCGCVWTGGRVLEGK